MNTTIALEYPATISGQMTNKITLKRATVKEMLNAQRRHPGDLSAVNLHLAASLSGIGPDDLEDLDGADYLAIVAAVREITGSSHQQTDTGADGAVTLTLSYPMEGATTISIRRPKARQILDGMRNGRGNAMDTEIKLLAELTGRKVADIERLDMSDYAAAQEILSAFVTTKHRATPSVAE